jgi:hypothetical protein
VANFPTDTKPHSTVLLIEQEIRQLKPMTDHLFEAEFLGLGIEASSFTHIHGDGRYRKGHPWATESSFRMCAVRGRLVFLQKKHSEILSNQQLLSTSSL